MSELINGVTYSKSESSDIPSDGYLPILRANNINGKVNFDKLIYVPKKRITANQLLKKFDNLIAMSSGSKSLVGKSAQLKEDFEGSFGAFCGVIRCNEKLNSEYAYRLKKELPPEIKGVVDGTLFSDLSVLEKWRNWKNTNLFYENKALNVTLSGALDDCLIQDNFYVPLDYKTRGSKLIEDPRKYYQTQLDCYCLILESSGYKTKNLSYLIYYQDIPRMGNPYSLVTIQFLNY